MPRLFSLSRYILLIPVVVTMIAAIAIFVAGAIVLVMEMVAIFGGELSGETLKQMAVSALEVVDIFLLATVLYIISFGLYELFIGELDLPNWLTFKNLDDLKAQLLSAVVTVLGVFFLGVIVSSKKAEPLILALSITSVVLALTFFLSYKSKKSQKIDKEASNDQSYAE